MSKDWGDWAKMLFKTARRTSSASACASLDRLSCRNSTQTSGCCRLRVATSSLPVTLKRLLCALEFGGATGNLDCRIRSSASPPWHFLSEVSSQATRLLSSRISSTSVWGRGEWSARGPPCLSLRGPALTAACLAKVKFWSSCSYFFRCSPLGHISYCVSAEVYGVGPNSMSTATSPLRTRNTQSSMGLSACGKVDVGRCIVRKLTV